MKKCPYCAEEIQDEAIKCKHCGEFLDGRIKEPSRPQAEQTKVSWFFKPASIVLSVATVGPFALPLIWFHPQYSKNKKIVITIIVLIITYVLGAAMGKAFHAIMDYQNVLSM